MANILCHHNGRYNFYTTIADGFCYESSLTLDQVKQLTKEQYGEKGMDELPARLERAHKNGSSAHSGETLDDFLCCNRAGENESFLTTEECIARYLS